MEKDTVSARETRLRRAAAKCALVLRKVRSGQDRGRYMLLDTEINGVKASRNRTYPNSFSLDEAEDYLS